LVNDIANKLGAKSLLKGEYRIDCNLNLPNIKFTINNSSFEILSENYVINSNGQCILGINALGKKINENDLEIVSTKIETNIQIFKRQTHLYRISEIIEKLDLQQRKICLQHLYFKFLLNVGDSSLYNILLSKNNEIIGIEFEEKRNELYIENIYNIFITRNISKIHQNFIKKKSLNKLCNQIQSN